MHKKTGVLAHISMLPNKYGIGTLGKSAFRFVDFLASAKQHFWQVLPLNQTSYGDSPYQGLSSFGYNPYFIDFDLLEKWHLLSKDDYQNVDFGSNNKRIDYGKLFENKIPILKKTYQNVDLFIEEFEKFKNDNQYWLDDYAIYSCLKENFDYQAWYNWPRKYKYYNKEIINQYIKDHYPNFDTFRFIQFLFYKQWLDLKKYANSKKIKIIGDMPIYPSLDSVDVWAHPKFFLLDDNMLPTLVAGVPPDAFSETGQLWGNPLYDWKYLKEDNYDYFVQKSRFNYHLFDYIRLDHFRGFAGYYAIPYKDSTASNGFWLEGPAYDLFRAIKLNIPNIKIIAENLGVITNDVDLLLERCAFPGMNVFQFEFGDFNKVIPFVKGYPENNVFYTGTHDNQTLKSFYHDLPMEKKEIINHIIGIEEDDNPVDKMILASLEQNSFISIVSICDYLNYDDKLGRINVPSTKEANWNIRLSNRCLTKDLGKKMKKMAIMTGRT